MVNGEYSIRNQRRALLVNNLVGMKDRTGKIDFRIECMIM